MCPLTVMLWCLSLRPTSAWWEDSSRRIFSPTTSTRYILLCPLLMYSTVPQEYMYNTISIFPVFSGTNGWYECELPCWKSLKWFIVVSKLIDYFCSLLQLYGVLGWYRGELLTMARDLATRLLPAFNTTTGIPHAKVLSLIFLV